MEYRWCSNKVSVSPVVASNTGTSNEDSSEGASRGMLRVFTCAKSVVPRMGIIVCCVVVAGVVQPVAVLVRGAVA